ncbi:phosphohydrolase [Candidatus Amesbacteria bacterium RIFCSPLOWO2_01_FULL_47_33]|uniref:Metal dependent phosphohydrolase n=2 Tax=Candidatus Amesiibacteriota TaxID=1752730 RepID=A0A0G1UUX5_9BACT|nr:MAG: Metal dependent phosphohydrolase [Candidatus Amesbacteria bacterium GW2011_GWB1_48_13]OGD00428.1 MAG: phosphohydrolase [Candidatus Amesbacteria bacterium RIFCSPLOWO2_01_FULL_47_33]
MNSDKTLIRVPLGGNSLLREAISRINLDEEVSAVWEMSNTNAMKRMGWSDHGPVHFQIVANGALRMCRILVGRGIPMGIVADYGLSVHHAELVVVLASLFHDLGMMVNRQGHEEFSLFISLKILDRLIDFLPVREKVIVEGEVLHAIINHRDDGRPYTAEAGIVRVADALDMSGGRSRIPFEQGEVNIHSLSAYAIDKVEIAEGTDIPILITVSMNNSSGLFQVDELLKEKLKNSGIEKYCAVKAYVNGESEKKLITEFVLGNSPRT